MIIWDWAIQTHAETGDMQKNVKAMLLMFEQDTPEDDVVGSGDAHSVRKFSDQTFSYLG